MIVVDASAIVDVLLKSPDVDRLAERLFGGGETLHAPHLLDVEVAQVLRRFEAQGVLGSERGNLALQFLQEMPITRHSHSPFLSRLWELRRNFTAYDGIYVALAEVLGATFVTRDKRLSRAPGHNAVIEVI